jgi:hypothetical protein
LEFLRIHGTLAKCSHEHLLGEAGNAQVYNFITNSPTIGSLFALWTSNVERADLVTSDTSAVELKPAIIFRLSGSDKHEKAERCKQLSKR